jgi:hypothetical protein
MIAPCCYAFSSIKVVLEFFDFIRSRYVPLLVSLPHIQLGTVGVLKKQARFIQDLERT